MGKRRQKIIPVTYRNAGVDIDEGELFIERIKEKLPYIGGFSGIFPLKLSEYRDPALVATADGVGTKLLICEMMGQYNTIGIDLVAMVVNDLVVYGAEPLFFLDYYATGKLKVERAEEIMTGIIEGCRRSKCILLGGETAELPGLYGAGQFDLAGFGVGIVNRNKVIDGKRIKTNDVLIGIASNGLHSNGYSLARHILLEKNKCSLDTYYEELNETLGECLLRPTIIYTKLILDIVRNFDVKGIAHITGGGIRGNLARILPYRVDAEIYIDSWEVPPIFEMIRRLGP
ncbi:phosphoribosylformylglycinamidine cyclo-ligase, partial [Candidatus Sumerlaeota bacterium]|nr:phosphoribosylformylglycinamidine cyclo-ligase [Candidatus Sumerlaeota bacterium]